MPARNPPSDARQNQVLQAFKKLGFEVRPSMYGKGSHRMVRDPKSGISIVVQSHIRKDVLHSFCKSVEELGYDADLFIKYL